MQLVPLPALADNYIWLLHDGRDALIVDPGQADVVRRALAIHGLKLRGILLTHHHADHTAGVRELVSDDAVPVYAPPDERIATTTHAVRDGETLQFAQPHATFTVLDVRGHTRSHVAYVGEGLLLCGDTLFSLGCGRMFEGTPAQMLASLDRLSRLPPTTQVCAGHEYTAANGRFADTVDPANASLQARRREVERLRAKCLPTLPVSLGSELASNPFLRVDSPSVADWCRREHAIGSDREARFAALRGAKDGFS